MLSAILVLTVLLQRVSVCAQNAERTYNPILFERISAEQGLASSTVHYVLQDRRGMLWFATEDGISKYDGVSFTTFHQMLPESLGTGAHSCVVLYEAQHSPNHELWIATKNRRTVSCFSPVTGEFRYYVFPNSVEVKVTAFAEESNGNILIGTNKGIFRWSQEHRAIVPLPERGYKFFAGVEVQGIARDEGDVLWIVGRTAVYRFDARTGTVNRLNIALEGAITTCMPEYDTVKQKSVQALWIATQQGLWRYALYNHSAEKVVDNTVLQAGTITALYIAPRHVWVGTDNGIGILEGPSGSPGTWRIVQRYWHDEHDDYSLADNVVQHIMRDRSGVVWIATSLNGVSKYSPFRQKFRRIGDNLLKNGGAVRSKHVRGVAEQGEYLWLATYTQGVHCVNRKTSQWKYFGRELFGTDTIGTVYVDARGTLWAGTIGQGLWRWFPARQRFERYPHIPPYLSVQILFEDSSHTLWVGAAGKVIYAISPNRLAARAYALFSIAFQHDSSCILSMLETSSGQLLLGSMSGLLELERSSGVVRRIVDGYTICAMVQDAQGDLWFGTHNRGVLHCRMKSSRIRNERDVILYAITEREGLISNAVSAMLYDDRMHHLWVSTKQGIAEIDAETRKVVRTFSTDDGLQGKEFLHGAAFRSVHGEMFFGGVNGVNAFFPHMITINTMPPPVEITSVKKFGREEVLTDSAVAASRSITLRYDENTLSFSFVALDFHAPEANTYAYRMEGLDKGWTQCGTRREATYTSLNDGEYVFMVRAANNDGVWNNTSTTFRIVITPPIWRTWWFLGLSGASIICVGFVLYRVRIRSIEARNAWLEQQVKERTAEIQEKNKELQQSLDEIRILSSVLESERNKSEDLLLNILPPSIAERLKWGETTIVDTFDSATVLFTDMVGFTKIASRISAEELIVILNRMFSVFDKLAEKHGVEKIKTIGDAYMAVAGVPIPTDNHAQAIASMALDMMQAIQELAQREQLPIQIRAGIHTGYLTAGVIGEKKFAYDLWGDTVNTASRMESSGEAGRIQCSEATYRVLKEQFDFEERGTIEIKGKGVMKTYFLLGRKRFL
ncbi:MAG: adenylate/guanylate cyclase domain-containing protein [Bacteroidota bacterium]|nr:hypothetical protein [Candidatus Kapabacteria bacterium]MDW8220175.1 adenylate/guanylate cyclase domain-containing protein [Bacteroidota bacterium]